MRELLRSASVKPAEQATIVLMTLTLIFQAFMMKMIPAVHHPNHKDHNNLESDFA
jgi:hypothetical protein